MSKNKKEEENGITTIKVVQEVWKKDCPECGKKLTGINRKQLVWNFNIHHQSCKRKMEEEEDEE